MVGGPLVDNMPSWKNSTMQSMLSIDWNDMPAYGESIWDANKDSIRWMEANSFFCDFALFLHFLFFFLNFFYYLFRVSQ